MLAQALEGLPGLKAERDGSVLLDYTLWTSQAKNFQDKLDSAFKNNDFEAFEPGASSASSWSAFLWEIRDRETPLAKIQTAGPLTAGWALRRTDGKAASLDVELSNQILKLVLAKSIAMIRSLKAAGTAPLLFVDEPGLYGLSVLNPNHILGLRELKVFFQTLKKEGAITGLHCCSNTDWPSVLALGFDFLSIDTHLSLDRVLSFKSDFEKFVNGGGRLSLGVLSTSNASLVLNLVDSETLYQEIKKPLSETFDSKFCEMLLKEALYTPACGLAYHGVQNAEIILSALQDFSTHAKKSLKL
jgi:hypothetical protein